MVRLKVILTIDMLVLNISFSALLKIPVQKYNVFAPRTNFCRYERFYRCKQAFLLLSLRHISQYTLLSCTTLLDKLIYQIAPIVPSLSMGFITHRHFIILLSVCP